MTFPRFFGIGHPRTGSHSLAVAIAATGLRSLHLGADHAKGGTLATTMFTHKHCGLPLLSGLEDFDAVIDWPLCAYWETILERQPGAKFILTTRNPHAAALSWLRLMHVIPRPDREKIGLPTSLAELVTSYTMHQDRVMRAFLDIPNQLLVIDAADRHSTKMTRLCKFLEVPYDSKYSYPTAEDSSLDYPT